MLLVIAVQLLFALGVIGQPAWDGLAVRFGLPGFAFYEQPRTVDEAERAGFTLETSCSDSNGFLGARYIRNNDPAVMLLFDGNDYILGIQAAVPKNLANGYPSSSIRHLFNDIGSQYVITAYFNSRGFTCSQGRTSAEYDDQGTGTGLYIQNGPDPRVNVITIPLAEADMPGTPWSVGRCFVGMGNHYWYNTSRDMDCTDFAPVFLLYNGGRLNSFGWAFMADLSSEIFEHPPPASFELFMNPVPRCLENYPAPVSTLHVYLTSSPLIDNFC